MLEHIKPPDEMDISYEWSKEVDLYASLFNTWIQGNLSYSIARNILEKKNKCMSRPLLVQISEMILSNDLIRILFPSSD